MADNSSKEAFLRLLDDITGAAVDTGHIIAVLALGSSGAELDRMDEYSDLDVWIIAEAGHDRILNADLDWLKTKTAVEYSYRHGADGYTVLFEGGITAEISLMNMAELESLLFHGARIIWKADGIPDSIGEPRPRPQSAHGQFKRTLDELLGEALVNLYVGIGRYYRGEKLTAMRFVQVYAVDRITEMASYIETEANVSRDPFVFDRRVETRFPNLAINLPAFTQGYDKTLESARAILDFFSKHFKVDEKMKQAIELRLAQGPGTQRTSV